MGGEILIPDPEVQVQFAEELRKSKRLWLIDALRSAVKGMRISELDAELHRFVPEESLGILAAKGLRAEVVFPVPLLLRTEPRLLGYYRLLCGHSQKAFYLPEMGLSPFKSMETKGEIAKAVSARLDDLCKAFVEPMGFLVSEIPQSQLSSKLFHELTLLTLGPQLRGGALNRIGKAATARVFESIKGILEDYASESAEGRLELVNPAGRMVTVEFASDPDIVVRMTMGDGNLRNVLAIEIKGGTDISNIHNRLGEAEKSHQKARKSGFRECWTVINVPGLDDATARVESPTTDRFYQLRELAKGAGPQFEDFFHRIQSMVGI
ncbi:MAG: XcyI family restriction endonuclease [Verrucomicrobiae bacterium]|nr:XcyI family restriction endonuclease [Verrucomicrobiae bacterium]